MTLLTKFGHYKIGVSDIDIAHLEMFALLYLGKYIKTPSIIYKLMDTVQELWILHTAAEESLMKEVNYPYTDRHRDDHEKIKLKIISAIEHLQPSDNYYVMIDLLEVLTTHFEYFDSGLTPYVDTWKNSKGI